MTIPRAQAVRKFSGQPKYWYLVFGFALIIATMMAIGLVAFNKAHLFAGLTSKLYCHPLAVSNAVLEADAGIVSMHRSMKDVALARAAADLEQAIARVEAAEQGVYRNFELVMERFLGDKSRIVEARQAFVDWAVIRAEVIDLMRAGRYAEAAAITKGKGADHVAFMIRRMDGLIAFARNKAAEFLADSEEQHRQFMTMMGWLLAGAFVMSVRTEMAVRLRAENAARDRAVRLNTVLDEAVDGIITITEERIIEGWNGAAEEIFGFSAEEAVGETVDIIVPQAEKGTHDHYLKRYRETGRSRILGVYRETKGRHKDGSEVPISIGVSEVRLGDKRIFTAFVRDITERVRVERQLRKLVIDLKRSNEELEKFAYVASHDLQEPLRKVRAFGDRLQQKYADALDERGQDYLKRMQNTADRMSVLINDLLKFSRVSTQGKPFKPTDLGRIVDEVLADLEIPIKESGAQVSVGDLPTVDADPLQARQMFQNLIGNAIKYRHAERAPEIRIQALPPAGHSEPGGKGNGTCSVRIEDNGIGFSQEYADRIFEIFQRLHGRQDYQGTGVGLAIARRIAERHGGGITAEGRPGDGAAFTVTLAVDHAREEKPADG